jgi:hypothetical protein
MGTAFMSNPIDLENYIDINVYCLAWLFVRDASPANKGGALWGSIR